MDEWPQWFLCLVPRCRFRAGKQGVRGIMGIITIIIIIIIIIIRRRRRRTYLSRLTASVLEKNCYGMMERMQHAECVYRLQCTYPTMPHAPPYNKEGCLGTRHIVPNWEFRHSCSQSLVLNPLPS